MILATNCTLKLGSTRSINSVNVFVQELCSFISLSSCHILIHHTSNTLISVVSFIATIVLIALIPTIMKCFLLNQLGLRRCECVCGGLDLDRCWLVLIDIDSCTVVGNLVRFGFYGNNFLNFVIICGVSLNRCRFGAFWLRKGLTIRRASFVSWWAFGRWITLFWLWHGTLLIILSKSLYPELFCDGQEGVELFLGDINFPMVHKVQYRLEVGELHSFQIQKGMLVRIAT